MRFSGNLKRKQEDAMIEKFIAPGDKVELKSIVNVVLPDGTKGVRTYKTSVHDVQADGRIEIVMPMEQTKLVLLPLGGEYDVCFFSEGGMFSSSVKIIDRQKINGIYVLVTEMTSSLHKFQRREYYRFNCIVEAEARQLDDLETEMLKKGLLQVVSDREAVKGVIVDISGGGARFVSSNLFGEDSIVIMRFNLSIMDELKPFMLTARVIYSNEIENRPGEYENRVKFEYINSTTREEIIKYIFDEERKNRKNCKGC
jgi:c-di-GMP-binding flagellar brake protein YcgR